MRRRRLFIGVGSGLWVAGCVLSPIPDLPNDGRGIGGSSAASGGASTGGASTGGISPSGGAPDTPASGGEAPLLGGQGGQPDP